MSVRYTGGGTTSGTPHGGPDSLEIKEIGFSLGVKNVEINVIQTAVDIFNISITNTESSPTQTEFNLVNIKQQVETNVTQDVVDSFNFQQPESNAVFTETIKSTITQQEPNAALTETNNANITQFESNAIQTEARATQIRCWASTSSDNDASRTTPTNANGQNNGTNALVKTNNSLGNLTNPVILSSTTFNNPTTGTFASKLIRVWFSIGANALSADTIKLFYNIGAGDITIYTHADIAVNHSTGTFTFDISGLTLANITAMTLKASYTSAVVASPNTAISLDAWAIELTNGI